MYGVSNKPKSGCVYELDIKQYLAFYGMLFNIDVSWLELIYKTVYSITQKQVHNTIHCITL